MYRIHTNIERRWSMCLCINVYTCGCRDTVVWVKDRALLKVTQN